jgi:hypothetical protein
MKRRKVPRPARYHVLLALRQVGRAAAKVQEETPRRSRARDYYALNSMWTKLEAMAKRMERR